MLEKASKTTVRRGLVKGVATSLLAVAGWSGPGAWAAGDVAAGRDKAETCKGCHAIENYNNTYPTYRVPKLRGQNVEYIMVALRAYRDGLREHGTMQSHAESMTDQDIEDIAAYIGSLDD